jgi:DNA mismatch repair protein MSH2
MEDTIVSLAVAKKGGERKVGACVYKRLPRKTLDDKLLYSLELVEFLEENEQYSTLDAFLVQIGNCILYLSDELEDASSGEGKKIQTLLDGRDIHEIVYVKKSNYQRKSDFTTKLSQLVGQATHVVNVAESERPLASNCAECLINVLRLTAAESEDYIGHVDVLFGSVNAFMRIDSSVAEAVNLLPKADHPSQFGSIYGVLNRCKTKMGSRLLDKWLRQPLIKVDEINERLDIVEILKETATYRNRLCDGPMKGMPDIDAVASKMQKKNAGLEDAFRVYVFSRSIPSIVSILNEAVDSFSAESEALMKGECAQKMVASLKAKFIQPLESLDNKFNMFQQLIEHVIDMDQLPNVEVNPAHDTGMHGTCIPVSIFNTLLCIQTNQCMPISFLLLSIELQELRDERDALEAQAEGLLQEARSGFASFASVHLDKSSQHGIAFRTTKGDDERQLRANNHKVNILSILKVCKSGF